MAEAVILSTVTKIGIALGNEATKQANLQFRTCITQLTELHGSMGRIGRELRLMHEYLCRMDIRNRKNQAYGIWVLEVRKLGHGIEDIVDEYLYLIGHKHDTGWGTYLKKGCKHPSVMFSLNRIALLVKEAEINLVHLFKAKDRWVSMAGGGNTSESSYTVESSQHLASISRSLSDEDLVGVDENREKLEHWLAANDMERSVIALDGMGGLGKTALAANIYKKNKKEFECQAWVSFSQTYSIKDVLKCLIIELYKERSDTPGNIDNMSTNDLQDLLKTFLEDKKYLIVLDDIWAPEATNDLLGALIQNKKGSRVLLTTRVDDVAHLAFEDRRITLKGLSQKESMKLFCKATFPRNANNGCPGELEELAQEIVSKCKGIPLAICTVGRLLFVRDKTKEEFKRICDQLDWELINNPSMEHVRNILYLSYIYLPTYLKNCFLYCSLFPEDYLFQRKKLLRLWIAEGFIEERGESTLEEVAEDYLQELFRRNMLQLVGNNSFGRMKKFKMHDILRELAVDMCHKDCFGVTYEEDKCRGFLEKDGRRLVVHKLTKDIQQSFSGMHCLRSVITLDRSMPSFTLLPLIAEKSRYMSVLELSGLLIEKIPDAIGDLFNLRHLGLRGTKVKLLPKSIEKLSNLMTLDLGRSSIKELPRGIIKLKKLRHLFAEKLTDTSERAFRFGIGVHFPNGIGNLINLQTLKALEAQDESVRNLGQLRQLRTLRIWNVKETDCGHLCKSLDQMLFLSNLYVVASDEKEVLLLNALPPNLQKLNLTGRLAEGILGESPLLQDAKQNLYSLGLHYSQLGEKDPLPFLSRLANLTELRLTRAYSGKQMLFLTGWFPKLKKLYLVDLIELKRLEIQQGTMASLEKLVLVNLNSMVEVPLGIEFLVLLQLLAFREITQDFLAVLRQSPKTKGKFRHTLRGTKIDHR